jgi:hypothetical protein
MTNLPHFTSCGLRAIDSVPFGMHACHFYSNRDGLLAALVPYLVAGLRANERCIAVTAPPLPAHEAVQALRDASDGVDDAIKAGALRILDFDHWYTGVAGLKGVDLLNVWLDEEERALADGYNGLRIAGNTSFLKPGDWSAFREYEEAVGARFKTRRILALCSYPLAQFNDQQISEVVNAHHCAFQRLETDWQVVAAPMGLVRQAAN